MINYWYVEPTHEPNVAGKLAGYCKDCGMMKIMGEKKCVRCGCEKTTSKAPKSKMRIFSDGFTNSTRGMATKIDLV